jgi:hypothetical protein
MPPRCAGKINGMSSRGGRSSSAASARRESGTWRRLAPVLPDSTTSPLDTVRRDAQDAVMAVHVAAFERLSLLGSQADCGGEDRYGTVGGGKLGGDGV